MPTQATSAAKPKLSKQAQIVVDELRKFLKGKLAQDVRLPFGLFAPITKKNYPQAATVLERKLKDALRGKLAADASLSDMHGFLESLTPEKRKEEEEKHEGKDDFEEENPAVPVQTGYTEKGTMHDEGKEDMHGVIREHLAGKLSDDDIEDLLGKLGKGPKDDQGESEDEHAGPGSEEGMAAAKAAAKDEDDEEEGEDDTASTGHITKATAGVAGDDPPPFKGQPEVGGKIRGEDKGAKDKHMGKDARVRKSAMDAAIADAVKRTERATVDRINGINAARDLVRPWVGNLAGAFDSAEGVKRAALKVMGVAGADKMHAEALDPVLQAQPKSHERTRSLRQTTEIAQDSAGGAGEFGFDKMFPDAARIGIIDTGKRNFG